MPLWFADSATALQGHGYDWSQSPPPPPPPPAGSTIFGYNTHAPAPHTLAGKQAWWGGRAPMVRVYYTGMLPATFDLTTATCPEKRACVSFQADSTFTAAGLASGSGNARALSYVQSIPAGWRVDIVPRHEANLHIPASWTGAQFVGVFAQMYPVIQSATLRSGVTVKLYPNFSAYQLSGSTWSDSWVPTPDICDLLTWDMYGNPGNNTSSSGSNIYGGPATGSAYGTTYALLGPRTQQMFAITERLGFAQRWGILELNAPARDWDKTEAGRAKWHQDALAMTQNPPMKNGAPADVVLIWEMDQSTGAGWDQSYGRVSGNPLNVASAIKSYFVGSP
jgi:hypothetical protein